MRPLPPFLRKVRYRVLRAAIRFIRLLPYSLALNVFRFLGMIAYLVDPFHRKIAGIQMRAALGLHNPWRIVLKVFMNQGDILIDTIKYSYMSTEEIRSKIIVEGKEHLDAHNPPPQRHEGPDDEHDESAQHYGEVIWHGTDEPYHGTRSIVLDIAGELA